jgi:uncharacterized integral membrane protein
MNDERRGGYVDGQRVAVSDRTRPSATLILLLIVIGLAIAFFFQNGNSTTVHFLFFKHVAKTRWAIIVAVVIGIIIDRIFAIWWRHRGRRNTE